MNRAAAYHDEPNYNSQDVEMFSTHQTANYSSELLDRGRPARPNVPRHKHRELESTYLEAGGTPAVPENRLNRYRLRLHFRREVFKRMRRTEIVAPRQIQQLRRK